MGWSPRGQNGSARGGPMAHKIQSKCLCCGEIFTVDVRNRGRQKYCWKRTCRAAGKAARQRRWLGKPGNQDYFCGPEHVERVRTWRAAHPGYWRAHRRSRRVTLQDALTAQAPETPADLTRRALQDALRCQGPVLIGLIAHLSDSALQDDIASATRGLLELGQDILSGQPRHAPQASAAPGPAATGSAAV
jgi:hypothetical protein